MLRAAGRCIVVADSSKFGRKSLTLVAGLEAVNAVVSDDGLSQEWRDFVTQTGANLIIAAVPPEAPESPTRPLRKREIPTS